MVQLSALPRDAPEQVGGKALHLAELISGGFAVPDGFCVTTWAYRRVVQDAVLEQRLDDLAATPPDDASSLSRLAQDIARLVLARPVPADITDSVVAAYHQLGEAVPVAVRSSATAEDLPFAELRGTTGHLSGGGRRPRRARGGSRLLGLPVERRGPCPTGRVRGWTREQSGSLSWCSAWCLPRWPVCSSPPTPSPGDGARPSSTLRRAWARPWCPARSTPTTSSSTPRPAPSCSRRLGDKRVEDQLGCWGRPHPGGGAAGRRPALPERSPASRPRLPG